MPLFQSKLLIFIIFGFTMWHVEIFVSWPGIEPMPLAVVAQRSHHWTARKFPKTFHFKMILDLQKVEKKFLHAPCPVSANVIILC